MRQQILALAVVGVASAAGMLSSTAAAAASDQPAPATASARAALAQQLITTAEQYIGYGYSWAGGSPQTGFSCIGLVYYVYTVRNGVPSGRNLDEAFASAPHVDRASLQPADLVFFSGTVPGMSPLSHVAIYVGNGKMIAADSFQTGVEWDDLNSTYWSSHYAGATRPLAAAGVAGGGAASTGDILSATATAAPTSSPQTTSTISVSAQPTPQPVPATAAKGATLTVTQDSLVVRSGPDDSYMEVATVASGDTLTVLQAQDTWYQVVFATSQVGWVAASAVSVQNAVADQTASPAPPDVPSATATASPAPTATPEQGGGYVGAVHQQMAVVADILKVHAVPGLKSPVVGQLPRATTVTVLKVQRDWDLVASRGVRGWVFSRYLSADLTLASSDGVRGTSPDPVKPTTNVQGFKERSTYSVVVVTADVLKVHATPSVKGVVITQVHNHDRLRVVHTQGDWLYVMMRGGKTGWVSARWVRAEVSARVGTDVT